MDQKNKARAEKMADVLPGKYYYCSGNPFVRWLNRERIRHVLDLAGDMRTKRILDAGVGDGFMLEKVECNDLWGIDISEKRCARASEKVPSANISVQDIHGTEFSEGFFDGIICADVLEHVEDPAKAVREMLRIVKQNGFIVVSVPNEKVNIAARILFLRFPIILPDHLHHISTGFLKTSFSFSPKRVVNIPNISDWFCFHRISLWEKPADA